MPLTEPTRLVLAKTYIGTDDPDAAAYIAAVEAADEAASPGVGALETATKVAIHSFVKGCKQDGIWPAIKASCILAGARTLNGALVPLVGTAPTNNGPFVAGDYNRKMGLAGDGSTKYLLTNYSVEASTPNAHIGAFIAARDSSARVSYISGTGVSGGLQLETGVTEANRAFTTCLNSGANQDGDFYYADSVFYGMSRSGLSGYSRSVGASVNTVTASFLATTGISPAVFAVRASGGAISGYSSARIAFYSVGLSLDLALLDARVTTLINALGAAIP